MPEVSLRESLEKGFDEQSNDPVVSDAAVVDTGAGGDISATPDAQESASGSAGDDSKGDGGRVRGPDGKFVKGSAKDGAESTGQPADTGKLAEAKDGAKDAIKDGQAEAKPEAQAQEVVADLPPSTFTPAAKAAYQALPKDSPLRQDIKKREADYQKGISQYKQAADFGHRINETIRPYEPLIRASGSTTEAAIAEVMRTNAMLRTGTPQERGALLWRAAQEFGADMTPYMGQRQQADQQGQQAQQGFDPQALAPVVQQLLSPHLQRIQQFESKFLTAQQQQEQAAAQEVNAGIESFRHAADSQGNPKHPYFDDVRALMGDFIGAGHATDMEAAYAMACRAHPEVSQIIASEQTRQQEAQRLAEAKRKAQDAARSAAVNATGQGGVGTADISTQSLRDDLSARYDAMSGGARL